VAKIPNGVETLPKISIAWVGCTNVSDDRQTTDGRLMTYSDSLKSIQVGTTTTTGTEHRARKLMPHATTVGPFTRSL